MCGEEYNQPELPFFENCFAAVNRYIPRNSRLRVVTGAGSTLATWL